MSSLPLVYGERADMAAVLAGNSTPHPLYAALNAAHDLRVADVLDARALRDAELLILVQPRLLAAEELVALDGFVRSGGRLLLFADPMLEWAGDAGRGLGDPNGPLRSVLISPLLRHWGLELIDPEIESVRLPASGADLVHPGRFEPLLGKTGDAACRIEAGGHVARCTPGQGMALLVADADLLSPQMLGGSASSASANRRFVASLIAQVMAEDTS
jgi:hypothetical protein